MDRKEIARVLEEIGVLLDLKGENPFKARAYYTAARTIEGLSQDVGQLVAEGRLGHVRGIGEALEKKIGELVTTGRMAYHEELRQSVPAGLLEMLRIPSLGPKKVRAIFEKLGIQTVGELEYACRENRLAGLEGFGARSQEKVLSGIGYLKSTAGTFLWPEVWERASAIVEALSGLPQVERIETAGSLRRHKEVCRDADILTACSDAAPVMEAFLKLPGVTETIAHGPTKSSVRLESGLQVDLRCVTPAQYPFALMYFTGSKEHNTSLRGLAKDLDLKLNEYGLFAGEEPIPCADEAAVFARLGLAYVPAELREDLGELDAARKGALPRLIERPDLRGVFHNHCTWSDGTAGMAEMARAAADLGLDYLGISDHSRTASYANGIKLERLPDYWAEVDAVNRSMSGRITVLKGIEADILPDGSMDYPDEVLARFDFVIASVHSSFTLPIEDQTSRVIRALENPYVSMLGHMTGRLLLGREGYALDVPAVLEAAARTRTVVELNANPQRLDIDWRHIRRALEMGITISINPDAHTTEGIADAFLGVGVGRKGWLTPDRTLNAWPLDEVRRFLAGQRALKAGRS